MSNQDLKACPNKHPKHKHQVWISEEADYWWVQCMCGRSTGWLCSEAEAISAWNTRSPDLSKLEALADDWERLASGFNLNREQLMLGCAKQLRTILNEMKGE